MLRRFIPLLALTAALAANADAATRTPASFCSASKSVVVQLVNTANITATGCGPRVTLHGSASLGAKLVKSTVPAVADRPSAGGTIPWWPIALVGFGGIVVGALFGRRRRGPNPS